MLGGMGSPFGAVVGGLLLGLFEQFSAGYISSTYKDAVAFVTILLVLFVMPSGLFGRRAASSGCERRCARVLASRFWTLALLAASIALAAAAVPVQLLLPAWRRWSGSRRSRRSGSTC